VLLLGLKPNSGAGRASRFPSASCAWTPGVATLEVGNQSKEISRDG